MDKLLTEALIFQERGRHCFEKAQFFFPLYPQPWREWMRQSKVSYAEARRLMRNYRGEE